MAKTGCRTCAFMRMYLIVAFALIFMIGFVPSVAETLLGRLPTPFELALLVPVLGIPAFVVRYVLWKRETSAY